MTNLFLSFIFNDHQPEPGGAALDQDYSRNCTYIPSLDDFPRGPSLFPVVAMMSPLISFL